jgi:hypothetical protein
MLESLHSCDRQNGKPQHKMHGNVFTEWVTGACDYNAQPHPPHFPFPSCYLPYGIPLIIIIIIIIVSVICAILDPPVSFFSRR